MVVSPGGNSSKIRPETQRRALPDGTGRGSGLFELTDYKQILSSGIWHNNPGLIQFLGICPLLAVSSSVVNGLGLGIATLAVLVLSNLLVSLLRPLLHPAIRLPVFVLVIASLVTLIELTAEAWFFDLWLSLGIFLPLIVTNCVILARAESYASKQGPLNAVVDGIAHGLGFAGVLIALGALREVLGNGTLFAGRRQAVRARRGEPDADRQRRRLSAGAVATRRLPRPCAAGCGPQRHPGARGSENGNRSRRGRIGMNATKRAEIFRRLREHNPEPDTELNYSTPFELLVAVILSAQATDVGVNKATAKLYPVANTPESILALGESGLKHYIKTIGLFNTKAKNVLKTCRILIEEHGSEVPDNRKDLEALPGVGRKTANVILNTAFGQPTIAVDTHIFRVSNRTRIAPGKTVLEVEKKLPEIHA